MTIRAINLACSEICGTIIVFSDAHWALKLIGLALALLSIFLLMRMGKAEEKEQAQIFGITNITTANPPTSEELNRLLEHIRRTN